MRSTSASRRGSSSDGSRFVWIEDFLPDAIAPRIDELMEQGLAVVKETLESLARSRA